MRQTTKERYKMKIAQSTTRVLLLTETQYEHLLTAVEIARASYEGIPEWTSEEKTYAKLLDIISE
jgi:hypothetical protein